MKRCLTASEAKETDSLMKLGYKQFDSNFSQLCRYINPDVLSLFAEAAMKIQSSTVLLTSNHIAVEEYTKSESLKIWVGNKPPADSKGFA